MTSFESRFVLKRKLIKMADVSTSSRPPEKTKVTPNEAPPPYYATGQQSSHQQTSVIYPPPAVPIHCPVGTVTTTTLVNNQPVGVSIVLPMAYGPHPINMMCPHCQATVVTAISPEVGVVTWVVSGGIALMGLFCGCCLIPFCVNELQDCRHSCPNCKTFLGIYRRM